MQFIKVDSPVPAADFLAGRINDALGRGKRILWLVSGGSSIAVAVAARERLQDDLSLLSVLQVDERFGAPGHPDSNWQKLLDAGFNTDGVLCQPVLTGDSFAVTARTYNQAISSAFQAVDFSIGLFGIGTNGHTAGIMPDSPAVRSNDLVTAYEASDFARITITPVAIAKLDEAVVYAVGGQKRAALETLRTDEPVTMQPAQALKQIKHTTIFNNEMEGNI